MCPPFPGCGGASDLDHRGGDRQRQDHADPAVPARGRLQQARQDRMHPAAQSGGHERRRPGGPRVRRQARPRGQYALKLACQWTSLTPLSVCRSYWRCLETMPTHVTVNVTIRVVIAVAVFAAAAAALVDILLFDPS
eukprot:scaffold366652_cov31-Prasinocladus_malaysianus.AAC.1